MTEKIDMGLAHLLKQGNKKASADTTNQCVKVTIPLSGREYFVAGDFDGGKYGPDELGMKFMDLYSEVRGGKGEVIAVTKHPVLYFIGTGLILETIQKPAWWSKRDSGGI